MIAGVVGLSQTPGLAAPASTRAERAEGPSASSSLGYAHLDLGLLSPTVQYGEPVSIRATVTDWSSSCEHNIGHIGCDWPEGSVRLYDNHVLIPGGLAPLGHDNGQLFPESVASFDLLFGADNQLLAPGVHYITASYEPGNFDRVSETTMSHSNGAEVVTVTRADCALSMSVSRSQTTGGDSTPVVFTADLVTSGHVGTIEFRDANNQFYGQAQISDGHSASVSLLPDWQLPTGQTTSIHATYSGDSHYNACTSGSVDHTVVAGGTGSGHVSGPTAHNDTYSINADKPFDADVMANDGLTDSTSGPPYTMTIIPGDGPNHGVATVTDQNHILYTPDPDFEGTDVLEYQLADSAGTQGNFPASVRFTVSCMPEVTDDTYTLAQDTSLSAGGLGVLENDSACHDAVPSVVTPPANGGVELAPSGGFVYTPNVGYSGLDSFTYALSTLADTVATVSLQIAPSGCTTTVVDDSYDVTNGSIAVPSPGVIANDQICNTRTALGGPPVHGSVTMADNGSFTYQADAGYSGPDEFQYGLVPRGQPATVQSPSAAAAATVHLNIIAAPTTTSSTAPDVSTTVAAPTTVGAAAGPAPATTTTPGGPDTSTAVGSLPATGTNSLLTLWASALAIGFGLACIGLSRRWRSS